jgi:predicted dehydrogenase
MSRRRYRTAIIGFGKIGAAYAGDSVMAKHYPVATHAQVLVHHPAFDWCAVVDPLHDARRSAFERWGIQVACETVNELASATNDIEVAVIATPPESRTEAVLSLPGLRAVVVEKPLGRTYEEAKDFIALCKERNIAIQVNYWRRADDDFRRLASGHLQELIGEPQAVFGIYGNGLRNNGSHMIDFCRMLFGEMEEVASCGKIVRERQAPIRGDIDVAFQMVASSGFRIMFQPLDFDRYRENSLDIWGSSGRLQIVQEGLMVMQSTRVPNRAMANEFEVASDQPRVWKTSVGRAFERLYDHTAQLLDGAAAEICSGDSALITETLVERIAATAALPENELGRPAQP